tara:strand:- start:3070 stop:3207 length:138 start_codon:yes stop_codon:yes gene_type:complete
MVKETEETVVMSAKQINALLQQVDRLTIKNVELKTKLYNIQRILD